VQAIYRLAVLIPVAAADRDDLAELLFASFVDCQPRLPVTTELSLGQTRSSPPYSAAAMKKTSRSGTITSSTGSMRPWSEVGYM
jgi:hypothetical protein